MLPYHTMKWTTESRSVRWPQSSAKLLGLKSSLKGRRRRSRIQQWLVVEDLANRAFSPGLPPSFLNNGCAFRTTTSLGIPENYIFPEMVYSNKRSSAVGGRWNLPMLSKRCSWTRSRRSKASARRMFMARTVQALGQGGQRLAVCEL